MLTNKSLLNQLSQSVSARLYTLIWKSHTEALITREKSQGITKRKKKSYRHKKKSQLLSF